MQTTGYKDMPHSTHIGSLATRMNHYQRLCGSFLRSAPSPVYLLSGMPGNIGDHLIWIGTETLLHAERIEFRRVTVDEVRIISRKQSAGTLVVPGSGAMTKNWHEWLPATIEVASKLFEKVVVLPSQYETAVGEVCTALSQPNVFAFARDAESYRLAREYGRAALALDPALWAFQSFTHNHNREERISDGSVLLALRTDADSRLRFSRLKASSQNNDISLTSASIGDFINTVLGCESVVSDRLHVIVACAMLGKSVKFIDTHDEKISRYVKFNFRSEFHSRLVSVDFQWLLKNSYVEATSGSNVN